LYIRVISPIVVRILKLSSVVYDVIMMSRHYYSIGIRM